MAKKKTPIPKTDGLTHITEQLRPLAIPLADLVLDPKNARKHNDQNLQAIVSSLKAFGQVKPIVVNRTTKIIEAGNGAFLAAKQLGWTHIAAVFVEHDATAARGFSLADNRTAELAEWDNFILDELLGDVQKESPELFEDLLFEEFLSAEQSADPAQAPESVEENISEIDKIKKQRQLRDKGNSDVASKNDTEKYLVIVFSSRDAREKAVERLGLPSDERYIAAGSVILRPKKNISPVQFADGLQRKAAEKNKSGAGG